MASSHDLYGGLSGVVLEPERFELGDGVVISQTYAHLMSHFIMAFSPAAPGKPHPGPWKAATGGFEVDVAAELFVPATCNFKFFDTLNTIWWIVALLRLKATTAVFVPVVSSESFRRIPELKHDPQLGAMEVRRWPLRAEAAASKIIGSTELEWLKVHWQRAGDLLANNDFQTAFEAIDFSIWNPSPALGLVALWGALERLFSTSTQELRFRASANIAAYLEPAGRDRSALFRQVMKLYDHRSKAAHGDAKPDIVPYQRSYAVARRVMLKMIETNHVPGKEELEEFLFGNEQLGTFDGSAN